MRQQRRRRPARTVVVSCVFLAAPLASAAPVTAPDTAFFYGASLPVEALSQFERVVVEPFGHLDDGVEKLRASGVEVFAYVSVGEVARSHRWHEHLKPDWIVGENDAWDSSVLDATKPGWRDFLLGEMRSLAADGYSGLFLDTLDSPGAAAPTPESRAQQEEALAAFLLSVHKTLPDVKLLFNRGFELLPRAHEAACGIVAESLFETWNLKDKRYEAVAETDRQWLLARLNDARDIYGLPVVVIDYVARDERERARDAARQIVAQGFTPYVAQPELGRVGIGRIEPVPRRVLLIYDGAQETLDSTLVHRLVAMPLEHLGYAAEYVDIRQGLPPDPIADRYVGVVAWLADDRLPPSLGYEEWLAARADEGVPFVLLGRMGLGTESSPFLRRLGMRLDVRVPRLPVIVFGDSMVGFEAPPRARRGTVQPVQLVAENGLSHLRLSDQGKALDAVATTPWGGFALDPFVVDDMQNGHLRWILNPFEFLRSALRLAPMPALDTTTENGRRLLTAHIDGDGFANRAEMRGIPFSGEVILREILERYRIPHTVSVIEGEVGPAGVNVAESPALEAIARKIFALHHVETASHTYSHPIRWQDALADDSAERLDIPGYKFDLNREIKGSVDYINAELAPKNKPVRVFLWSGYAVPGPEAVRQTRALGLLNVNGGNTQLTTDYPSMTEVGPLGFTEEGELQVYAPVQNENVFSNLWASHFSGFERVIESFRLTDAPRRLKPLGIYYHFYSGEKPAALDALRRVYDWVLTQSPRPVFLGELAEKVQGFHEAQMARTLDGSWRLRRLGALRTARLPPALGWPDIGRSRGVAGVRDLPQGRYVALSPGDEVLLATSPAPSAGPYLEETNASVVRWERAGRNVRLELQGHVPVELTVGGTKTPCRLETRAGSKAPRRHGDRQTFAFRTKETGLATLVCR